MKQKLISKLSDTVFGELKDLTDNLPPYPSTLTSDNGGNIKSYDVEQGESVAWKLYYEEGIVSNAKFYSSKGTIFQEHAHEQREWLIVFKGEMVLHFDKKEIYLKVGDYQYIKPHELHGATFPSDCEYFAITIPSCKDWPHGK